jgi:hypothetical protein
MAWHLFSGRRVRDNLCFRRKQRSGGNHAQLSLFLSTVPNAAHAPRVSTRIASSDAQDANNVCVLDDCDVHSFLSMPRFEMTIEDGPWSGMYAFWDGGNLTIDIPAYVCSNNRAFDATSLDLSLTMALDTIRARLVATMGLPYLI